MLGFDEQCRHTCTMTWSRSVAISYSRPSTITFPVTGMRLRMELTVWQLRSVNWATWMIFSIDAVLWMLNR